MIVDDVLIYERFRGQGHGKAMMLEVVEIAKRLDVDSVELTVNDDNMVARNLYQRVGFEETDKKYCRRILNIR
jgi:ribosomal protein S18 acetylase RimI-like enzyme